MERQKTQSLIKKLFRSLSSSAKGTRRSPNGCSTDGGELIGTRSYTLISVNGLAVEGQTFSDLYHEQEWENLNDQFIQRWVEDDEHCDSAFCGLSFLTGNRSSRARTDHQCFDT